MEKEYLPEEEESEWVEIQSPSNPSNSKQYKNLADSVIVSTKDGIFSNSEVIPPTNQNQNQLNDSNGEDTFVEIEDEGSVYRERKSIIVLGFEHLKCRVAAVVSRIRKNYGAKLVTGGRACFGAIFFLLVLLVYRKVQRRRRQGKLSEKKKIQIQIQEKDQKISELLLEIAQLKDILLRQRRVPVLRV